MPISQQDIRAFAKLLAAPERSSVDLLNSNHASPGSQYGVTSPSIKATRYGRAIAPDILPIQGRVTQGFGQRQAVRATGEDIHAGIDIAAPGGTPIPEVIGGVVVSAQSERGYGNSVVVRGTDGKYRKYSHLQTYGVKPGQRVNKGDIIGLVGTTGISTGNHLDYRVYLPE